MLHILTFLRFLQGLALPGGRASTDPEISDSLRGRATLALAAHGASTQRHPASSPFPHDCQEREKERSNLRFQIFQHEMHPRQQLNSSQLSYFAWQLKRQPCSISNSGP